MHPWWMPGACRLTLAVGAATRTWPGRGAVLGSRLRVGSRFLTR
ncbi:hypothetical protein SAMN04488085_10741 [Geodermatophilus ruber]|uniref:Uncharacterized protein n=1 Tax=Geodermatophilus ruber TaxID=504800 RepID=A0A1I4F8W6_9ACTN|nr:hypothetical protein SAMN04488085_10741 [Geodermatophilus ruber]